MKIIIILFLASLSFSVFAQETDHIADDKKQVQKDSVYHNRFNRGNTYIGGMIGFGFAYGDLTDTDWRQYKILSQYGFFLRNRLLLFIENETVYTNYKHHTDSNLRIFQFYSVMKPGIRYYMQAKRFTFFGEAGLRFSYNQEHTKYLSDFKPISFFRSDLSVGLGATFSVNKFDINVSSKYVLPILFSKDVSSEQNQILRNSGFILFTPSVSFYF
jgi:hypothetical protein